ncbi:Uncharacterised protein [Serratia fonticola]|nr:hypothetical protein DFO62_101381 [Serratia fonticola]CAI0721961.1 Uncharacterised protein [Serratia fonticola]CAI0728178.1 Uncharacterised protein [Serratia fonticola]
MPSEWAISENPKYLLIFYQTVIEIVFLFFICQMLGFSRKVDLNQNGKSF